MGNGQEAPSQTNVNRSAASRLPVWIKSAKNREAALHGVAILNERLRQF
jgi:hypothetical protein